MPDSPSVTNNPLREDGGRRRKVKVTNPIRPDALVARDKALLRYKTKDGTSKLFELTSTFPWRLRKHSAFLSLHFGSLGLFALLLLGYSLLSAFPLADCISTDRYKTTYQLGYQLGIGDSDDFKNILCSGENTESGRKKKPYPVGSTMNRMSLGSFCVDESVSGFSSIYDCSQKCKLEPEDVIDIDLEDEQQVSKLCLKTRICVGSEDKGCEPLEDAENDTCCTLDPTDIDNHKLPQSHVWIWVVAGMLLFCGWMAVLQYLQYSLAEAINLRNINVAQYAVLVSNVGNNTCNDKALEDFARSYGDVVSTFYVRDFGRFLSKDAERGRTLELLKELKQLRSEADVLSVEPGIAIKGRFSSFPGTWYLWLYKRYLCGPSSVDGSIKKLDARYEKLSAEVEALSNEEHTSTGNAVIVFNWVPDAANMLHNYNLRNTLANLFVPPSVGRSFNILTGGKFARTERMAIRSAAGNGEDTTTYQPVTVTRAPEPSDLLWNNTQFGGWPIVKRRIVAWAAYVALLVVSFTVQSILTGLEQRSRHIELVKDICEVEDEQITLRKQIPVIGWSSWTIVKTVVVLLFSNLGIGLIHILSDYSLFTTYTHNVGSTVTKIAVFQLINSFAVPLVATALLEAFFQDTTNIGLWLSEGGFIELGFLIQITNAIFPSIAFTFRMDDILPLHFLSHMACTQKYVDQFTLPPEFRMNLRMGQAITTVGLAILYAPILPISTFIGLLGIIVQYVTDQYMALRCSSRPRAFQVEAFHGANYLLRLLPLMQLFLILGFYFRGTKNWHLIACLVGLIIWGTACVVPLLNGLRQKEYAKWVEGGRPRLLDWARHPGEQAATVENVPYKAPDGSSEGLWMNTSTYLPDAPTLEPEIFTKHVKPFFTYKDPALSKVKTKRPPPPGTTVRLDANRYKHVEPNQDFTQALKAARGPIKPPPGTQEPPKRRRRDDEMRLPTIVFTPDF